jgi:hypothetical protein
LNWLRNTTADAMAYAWANGEPTEAEAKVIANYINIATGRGDLGKAELAANQLATAFFSPRLWASRLQYIAGQPIWTTKGGYAGTIKVRAYIAGEYGKFLLGAAALYLLSRLMDWEMELDPRSADFGKIKIGNTRIDPFAGLTSNITLLSRLATGQTKSTTTGQVSDLYGPNRKYGGRDSWDVLSDGMRTKFSPMFGLATDIAAREDFLGRSTDITTLDGSGRIAYNLMLPMTVRDVYEAVKQEGVPAGAAMGLASIFGWSIRTHDNRK